MAEDEEQTLRTFRAHKQVFESLVAMHRGRIFNTAGDAILAEFGSAVEAVRCATEIQAALRTRNDQLRASRQVRFRIGVNLGDVMVQGQDLLGEKTFKISGQWPGRGPGMTTFIEGEVSASGEVTIHVHTENAAGARLSRADLSGTLRDGRRDATGAFRSGRTVTVN